MVLFNWAKKIVPQKFKNIYHLAQSILANFFYGFPSRKIKIIGVTGTDGKTTTIQMVAKILEEVGKKVAVASTINFRINGKELSNETKFTTLSGFRLQKFIREALKAGCEYLVLEVSSHSLDQNRIWGVHFSVAAITNVTREHLDYHRTMEKYRKAKCKLFKNADTVIVNLDMEEPEYYLNCSAKNKYGYSLKIQNPKSQIPNKSQNLNLKIQKIVAENVELNVSGSRFMVNGLEFRLNLSGEFNVENALAATCVGISEGIDPETIKRALGKIKGIPGRMEAVPNDKRLNIIVDFALTPNALERLYELIGKIRGVGEAKIISVFGACGERDRGKRPIIGKIVSEHADCVILTDDEPYNEDPERIIEEIASGIVNKNIGKNFWKISDRREAIKKALLLAKPGDFVIVSGMGAENTRAVGNKRVEWNDKKVILEEFGKIK